jgi:RND superfamily putative drug exporter
VEQKSQIVRAWSQVIWRFPKRILMAWCGLLLLLGLLATQTPGQLSRGDQSFDRTQASEVESLIRAEFPERRETAIEIVFTSQYALTADRAYRNQVNAWFADVKSLTGSQAMVDNPEFSKDGHAAIVAVSSNRPPESFSDLAARIAKIKHPGPARVYLGGPAAVDYSLIQESAQDLQSSEWLALPIAGLLLVLVLGGLVAGGLSLASIIGTLFPAIAFLGLATRLMPVSIFALDITTVVGVALSIGYSLLMVSRFREEVAAGRSLQEAVTVTTARAGRTAAISSLALMAGFGALMGSNVNLVRSVGLGGMLVAACALLACLTLMPALLAVFGPRLDHLSIPARVSGSVAAVWPTLARAVVWHPTLILTGVAALLILMTLPALRFDPAQRGMTDLPPGDATRQAQGLAVSQFGYRERRPLILLVNGVADMASADQVEAQVKAAAEQEPVRGPGDVVPSRQSLYMKPPYAIYEVTPPGAPDDPATRALINRMKAYDWPAGLTVQLAGEPAAFQDRRDLLLSDLPVLALVVLGLTLIVVALAFRSLALAVKAICLNLLSVGATLGLLTFIFQQGHGASLLGFTPTGHVDLTVTLLLLAGLFALSITFEVFLLARVSESEKAGAWAADAVTTGVQRSGGVITGVALVVAALFAFLSVSSLTLNKSFGIAFALAVLIDAFLIRLLLVPAAMAVLDDMGSWPARYGRRRQRVQVPSGAPPSSTIPRPAVGPTQRLPAVLESGPLPDWISPRQTSPGMAPPWVGGPMPVAAGAGAGVTVMPGWEVVPHPVKVPTRERMPAVADEHGLANGSAHPLSNGHDGIDATFRLPSAPNPRSHMSAPEPPTAASVCESCRTVLAAPYMPCPACGLQPEDPQARPLYILDSVTGLYNQRFLQPQLEYELVRAAQDSQPLGVLVFESTPGSDDTLRSLADLVGSQLRETDLRAVVSRDPPRLVALLHNTDVAETDRLAGRVMHSSPPGAPPLRVGMVWVQAGSSRPAEEVVAAALRSVESGRPELL